jgi:trehalose/maltose hydrolase-like predicted phosphorylase
MEYENAPDSALGSVVPLLSYPLEIPMSVETKRNNLSNAIRRLDSEAPGAMMTITLLPLVAAELENREWFNKLFPISYQAYLRPPFYALAETGSNRSTNFVTGAGGFLQQVIFGYTGLRLTEDGLIRKFKPMLPPSIQKLKLKNFKVRNKTFNYEVP